MCVALGPPVTGSDHGPLPESHSLTPAACRAYCPLLSLRPDSTAADEGEGGPKVFLFKETNALFPSSVIRENIKATSDPPPSGSSATITIVNKQVLHGSLLCSYILEVPDESLGYSDIRHWG